MAFHSFVWPRSPTQAKSIVRILCANHCNWADVLIVRGRCFSDHHACFRADGVLENLLWNWDNQKRLYLVYKEGAGTTGGPVPRWFDKIYGYNQFCQCNFVGRTNSQGRVRLPGQQGWRYPGSLCSNVLHRGHQVVGYGCQQGCRFARVECPYPDDCNKNTMIELIAIGLTRGVPLRAVPLPSVLTTRPRKPTVEGIHCVRWGACASADCSQRRRNSARVSRFGVPLGCLFFRII